MLADAEVQRPAVRVAGELLGLPVRRAGSSARPPWWCCWSRRGRPSRPTARAAGQPARPAPCRTRRGWRRPSGRPRRSGRASRQPGVSSPLRQPVVEGLARRGWPRPRRRRTSATRVRAAWPRSTRPRVWAMTSSATSKVCSGSKPSSSLVAATSSSPSAEPCGLARALGLGGRPRDDRLQLMKLGRSVTAPAAVERGVQGGDVLDVVGVAVGPVDGLHVPAVRLVARGDVLAEGDVGVVLDRDPVAVVDQREVAQPLGAGQRGRLAGRRPPRCRRRRRGRRSGGRTATRPVRRRGRAGRARGGRPWPCRRRWRRPGRAGRW